MLHCHSSTMIFTCNICMYMTIYLFIVAICLPLYTKCFPLHTKQYPLYKMLLIANKMFPITYKTLPICVQNAFNCIQNCSHVSFINLAIFRHGHLTHLWSLQGLLTLC